MVSDSVTTQPGLTEGVGVILNVLGGVINFVDWLWKPLFGKFFYAHIYKNFELWLVVSKN